MCTYLVRIVEVGLLTVLYFKWSVKKHFKKILQGILEINLFENNHKSNFYKFSYNFAYMSVLSFRRNQKQESNFQQVGDVVTRNSSVYCL